MSGMSIWVQSRPAPPVAAEPGVASIQSAMPSPIPSATRAPVRRQPASMRPVMAPFPRRLSAAVEAHKALPLFEAISPSTIWLKVVAAGIGDGEDT